jgi:hypothetical protein
MNWLLREQNLQSHYVCRRPFLPAAFLGDNAGGCQRTSSEMRFWPKEVKAKPKYSRVMNFLGNGTFANRSAHFDVPN